MDSVTAPTLDNTTTAAPAAETIKAPAGSRRRNAGPPDSDRRSAGRNLAVGRHGERIAARYLQEHGLQVIARNWRCRDGEIDILARDGSTVVVCEVKTRTGTRYQHPAAAVGPRKASRLRHLAERWLHEHPPPAGTPGPPLRIDLVAVVLSARGRAVVEHLPGAC